MIILFPIHDLNFILKPLPPCALLITSVYLKMFMFCTTSYLKYTPKFFSLSVHCLLTHILLRMSICPREQLRLYGGAFLPHFTRNISPASAHLLSLHIQLRKHRISAWLGHKREEKGVLLAFGTRALSPLTPPRSSAAGGRNGRGRGGSEARLPLPNQRCDRLTAPANPEPAKAI